MFDDSDNLRLCKVCADRYATDGSSVCSNCREQEMIDEALPPPKDFVCWGCNREFWTDPEYCPFCGGEIWTREEVEAWQGVEDDE